eukprot:4719601-Pleurochrysis_carterae.AAC.1
MASLTPAIESPSVGVDGLQTRLKTGRRSSDRSRGKDLFIYTSSGRCGAWGSILSGGGGGAFGGVSML